MKPAVNQIAQLLHDAAARHRAGDLAGAEQGYRRALKINPRDPDALHLLGVVANQRGNAAEAMQSIRQALTVRDDFPDAHYNLASILLRRGEIDAAEAHYRKAIHCRPAYALAHRELAMLMVRRGMFMEAIACTREALKHDPAGLDGWIQLARLYRVTGDNEALMATVESGMRISPRHPLLSVIGSEAAFALGNLKEGWHLYRWRFQSAENAVQAQDYPLPHWQGEALTGRSIFLWSEQGIGDEVMYANMVSDLTARAARCVIQCSPRLAPLWARSFPSADILAREVGPADLTGIDFQSSMGALGEYLRPDHTSFPAHEGYLRPDPEKTAAFRAKYKFDGNPLLVGIAWRSAKTDNYTEKTVKIDDWGPILHVPGVRFVNLQYGDCRAELDAVAKGFGIHVIQDPEVDPLGDLDTYAAQVAAMDLVITSSNTAAHFAGALNIPLFCMLPTSLGRGRRWYWFAETGACPWYPSARLFCQRRDGEWFDVLRDVGIALVEFAVARGTTAKVAPYLRSIGKAYADIRRLDDAEHIYRRLASEPGCAGEGLHLAAMLRIEAAQPDATLGLFDEALVAEPGFWQSYNEKGMVLAKLNRIDEAVACYLQGLVQKADSVELHNNIGTALRRMGRAEDAIPHFREAMRLRTDLASVELGLASALDEAGHTDSALGAFNNLIARQPDYVDAHYNRAQLLLSTGHLEEGWRELQWRFRRAAANVRPELFSMPLWQGEDLAGKEILVWTEQGIGDEILVASMLPDAMAAAKRVTILCSSRMAPLMKRSFPAAVVAERKEPLPPAATKQGLKYQLSLSELGRAFRGSFDRFPNRNRFLIADAERRDALRRKYQSLRPGKRLVGISWRSHFQYEIGWLKSLGLRAWADILAVPNVAFVNLQYGDQRAELAEVTKSLGVDIIHDPDVDPLQDMDAFAAQVAAMDLVISVSNTTVHTAGALGVPVWVLLAEGRGRIWYWFRERADSPWYPSVRLLRQTTVGGWDRPLRQCASDLSVWAAAPSVEQSS